MTMSIVPALLVAAFAAQEPAFISPTAAPAAAVDLLQDRDPNTCAAHATWLGETQLLVRREGIVTVTLFSSIGSGVGSRCGTDIVLSAAFFDRNDALVCAGTVELSPLHSGRTSYTTLEIQPGNPYEFARWINGPLGLNPQWSRVACRMPDGRSEAQAADLGRMQSLRLHAVVPGNTGIGVAELRMVLQP